MVWPTGTSQISLLIHAFRKTIFFIHKEQCKAAGKQNFAERKRTESSSSTKEYSEPGPLRARNATVAKICGNILPQLEFHDLRSFIGMLSLLSLSLRSLLGKCYTGINVF